MEEPKRRGGGAFNGAGSGGRTLSLPVRQTAMLATRPDLSSVALKSVHIASKQPVAWVAMNTEDVL